jgi:rSAM/selenodomain-associated transferase 1
VQSALVVFVRAPIAGQVKTRLAATLGADDACALYRAFVEDTLAMARQLDGVELELAVAGPLDHPDVVAWSRGAALVAQPSGDLGARMAASIDRHVAQGRAVCVIGSDAPQLGAERVARAFDVLRAHEVVVGPSTDGGYWLIGARRRVPELLVEMRWSTPVVLETTLARLVGRSHAVIDEAFDVDEPDDLERLRRHLAATPPSVAPATRRALAAISC